MRSARKVTVVDPDPQVHPGLKGLKVQREGELIRKQRDQISSCQSCIWEERSTEIAQRLSLKVAVPASEQIRLFPSTTTFYSLLKTGLANYKISTPSSIPRTEYSALKTVFLSLVLLFYTKSRTFCLWKHLFIAPSSCNKVT